MTINIHIHDHRSDAKVVELLNHLHKHILSIMATQTELAQQLRDITAQNEKSRTEILGKIADLETALANAGNTSAEVDEAVAALKASVQTDDDIVADAPPVEPQP